MELVELTYRGPVRGLSDVEEIIRNCLRDGPQDKGQIKLHLVSLGIERNYRQLTLLLDDMLSRGCLRNPSPYTRWYLSGANGTH